MSLEGPAPSRLQTPSFHLAPQMRPTCVEVSPLFPTTAHTDCTQRRSLVKRFIGDFLLFHEFATASNGQWTCPASACRRFCPRQGVGKPMHSKAPADAGPSPGTVGNMRKNLIRAPVMLEWLFISCYHYYNAGFWRAPIPLSGRHDRPSGSGDKGSLDGSILVLKK